MDFFIDYKKILSKVMIINIITVKVRKQLEI